MDRYSHAASWLVFCLALPTIILAQQTTTQTSTKASASASTTSSRVSSTHQPSNGTMTSNPTSTSTGNSGSNSNTGPTINYYFIVVIALAICAFGATTLAVCLRRTRKRNRALTLSREAEDALQRDLARGVAQAGRGGDGGGRRERQWYGHRRRWHGSGDIEANEGLNEHGEAPPPYRHGRASGESRRSARQSREDRDGAVLLRVLDPAAGEDGGVKPPDYAPATVVEVVRERRSSIDSSMSLAARHADREHDGTDGWRSHGE